MADAERYDACVIGSGAAGGAVVYALTAAGYRVLVLERGDHHRDEDVFHDELAVCRRDLFTPSSTADPNIVKAPGEDVYKPTTDGWIARCVGGGTVLMSGFFYRMHPEDFRLASRFGAVSGADVADWPIAYEDLRPYYDQVERIIGVSGRRQDNPFAPPGDDYPLPPIATHAAGALVSRAAASLGLHPYQTPRAILSQPYDGRSGCHHCGFCGSYGCEAGAKSSSAVTFLAHAARTGAMTLRAKSTALRVVVDARGRARGVEYIDADGVRREALARVVVVAASATQSARLLLLSERGTSSGHLGKHLMFASHVSGRGTFARPHPSWPDGARGLPFIDRSVQDRYIAEDDGLPHPKAGTVLFLRPHPNPIFQATVLARRPGDEPPLWGAALVRRMRRFFREEHHIEYEGFGEFLPHPGCFMGLDAERRDPHGLPAARLTVDIHPATAAASELLGRTGEEVLRAAGAATIERHDDPRVYYFLQAGTARMGADVSTSVLDPGGQVHDTPNLYVADAAGFPSSGGAPFTLTIMANALRVGAGIVARGKRGEL